MVHILFSFLWSVLLALFALPTMMRVALFTNVMDRPSEQKKHDVPVPLLGGVGMYTALLSGALLFSPPSQLIQSMLAGSFFIFLIGAKDDIMGATPLRRLFVQSVAACMVMLVGDLRITHLHGIFGIESLPPSLSYGLTLLIILGITNAFNLIDGLDGLLGMMTLFCAIVLGYFTVHLPGVWHALCLPCGCCVGFSYGIMSFRLAFLWATQEHWSVDFYSV